MQDTVGIKCKACGGTVVPLQNNPRYYKCEYCGSVTTTMTDRETVRLERAFCKLRDGDFDDAEDDFADIIAMSPDCYEAYWGRLLARYGIIYVVDGETGKKIPTLNKMAKSAFLSDTDYIKAMQKSPTEIGLSYAQQGSAIDRILSGQIEVAGREKPYDIFICYKESDRENGVNRTRDSYECSELYVYLTGLGYRVFYARETLRSYISEDYEPYIYNALMTAKVMIVYSTQAEYVKATWVRNEWSRYIKMMDAKSKQPNSLIFAVSGMAVEQAPSVLASKQSLDASARTFYIDITSHIKKVIASTNKQTIICGTCGTIQQGDGYKCEYCGSEQLMDKKHFDMLKNPTPVIMPSNANARNIDPFEMNTRSKQIDPFAPKRKKFGCSTKIDTALSVIAWVAFALIFILHNNTKVESIIFAFSLQFSVFCFAGGLMLTILRAVQKQKYGKNICTAILGIMSLVVSIMGLTG